MAQLRQMDMKECCGDTQSLSMNEIMERMSTAKTVYRESKSPPRTAPGRIGGHQEPEMRGRQGKPTSPGLDAKGGGSASPHLKSLGSGETSKQSFHKQDHSIARFRIPEPKWDKSPHTAAVLLKSLYRVPNFDCSGKNMRSLGRDEAKGVITWVPPETDRNIPEVTPAACTASYRQLLSRHLDRVINRVDDDCSRLPARTERERKAKARADADLFELQQTMSKLSEDSVVRTSKRSVSPTGRGGAGHGHSTASQSKSQSKSPSHSRGSSPVH